ncbi:hypothetical protein KC343_g6502 [Hortaea werneckii]|nr:hypothetical protein KC323_g7332 [Hortaea werneckii]KAI6858257.1 hypothetical protein KC338_g7769 [Hortaea werneckii]KAI7348821.1 hypothetical protein KC320_g6409 [Hortaea werneckii]KAI7620482.1 hypothetical protein KC346_g4079 [Hortaea werneckii]KAI7625807.1 hypothetical protein KC343_g6502 [Hortaea werneckii]
MPADLASIVRRRRPSALHSQLEANLRQHQQWKPYGKPPTDLITAASQILPYRRYDLVFDSLRNVIFGLDKKSAMPIAHIIRDSMTDTQICTLIDGICGREKPMAKHLREGGLTEAARKANIDKLSQKMEEARVKHAQNLRESGLRDVEVVYKCDGLKIEPFKTDKEVIEGQGGRVYHLQSFCKRELQATFSAIIDPQTLSALYPPGRCAAEAIEVRTNTLPTAAGVPKPESRPGAAGNASNAHRARGGAALNAFDSFISRERSESVQQILTAPRVQSWQPYSSSDGMKHQHRSGKIALLSRDPGMFDNRWIEEDFAVHKRNLDAWDQQTWRSCNKKSSNHRHMSSKDEDIASNVAGEDYPTKEPLCNTYAPNVDYDRHSETVEGLAEREYKSTYACFVACIETAKDFLGYHARCIQAAKANPNDASAQQELELADTTRPMFVQELLKTRQKAIDSGLDCGKRPAEEHLCAPEKLDTQWREFLDQVSTSQQCVNPFPQRVEPARAATPTLGNTPRPTFPVPVRQVNLGRRTPAPQRIMAGPSEPRYGEPCIAATYSSRGSGQLDG